MSRMAMIIVSVILISFGTFALMAEFIAGHDLNLDKIHKVIFYGIAVCLLILGVVLMCRTLTGRFRSDKAALLQRGPKFTTEKSDVIGLVLIVGLLQGGAIGLIEDKTQVISRFVLLDVLGLIQGIGSAVFVFLMYRISRGSSPPNFRWIFIAITASGVGGSAVRGILDNSVFSVFMRLILTPEVPVCLIAFLFVLWIVLPHTAIMIYMLRGYLRRQKRTLGVILPAQLFGFGLMIFVFVFILVLSPQLQRIFEQYFSLVPWDSLGK